MGALTGTALVKCWRWLSDWGGFNSNGRSKIGGSTWTCPWRNFADREGVKEMVDDRSKTNRGLFLIDRNNKNKSLRLLTLLFWYVL